MKDSLRLVARLINFMKKLLPVILLAVFFAVFGFLITVYIPAKIISLGFDAVNGEKLKIISLIILRWYFMKKLKKASKKYCMRLSMMIKEIRRELKRQLQEMMLFKFNLFFSNFGILIMVSAYLQYFKDTQSKFLLLCLLFTWYFTSHSITHPTFFIEDDLYDRTLISVIQSSKSVFHVLMFKIIVQILVDLVKAIPIFIVLSTLNDIDFPDSILKLVGNLAACMLTIISMYGLGFCLSSLCFIFNRTSSITSLISYFMLYFTGILTPLGGLFGFIGKLFPYYALRNFIISPSYQSVFLIIVYCAVYWSVGTFLFFTLLNIAKKRGSLFHV